MSVEVVVVSEMARWCRDEVGSAAPVIELPDDVERCDNATGFVGVYKHGTGFRAQWKDVKLGSFPTAEAAALARYKEKEAERKRTRELLEGELAADPIAQQAAQPPPPVRATVGRYKCPFCYDWVRGTCPKCGTMVEARAKAEAEKAEKEAKAAANPVAEPVAPA